MEVNIKIFFNVFPKKIKSNAKAEKNTAIKIDTIIETIIERLFIIIHFPK
jgi:hypothetical protein